MSDYSVQGVATAALIYAHSACFSEWYGSLESDSHLCVLFVNLGKPEIASEFAKLFSQYPSDVANDDYSAGMVLYTGNDPGVSETLRIEWHEYVVQRLARAKAVAA